MDLDEWPYHLQVAEREYRDENKAEEMIENAPKAIALLALIALAWTLLLVRQNTKDPVLQPHFGYIKAIEHAPTTRTETGVPRMRCKSRETKNKAVIIFATTRSGSTFLGEFFNQHSEIYYLFEPLHGIGGRRKDKVFARQTVLSDLLKCNYSRVSEIYRDSENDEWIGCKSNICFSNRMELLWRNSDLCVGKRPYCGVKSFNPKTLEKICRQSLFTAIKTVATPDLSELEPILLDPELDLKVIQLVRDPRAVIPSVMKMINASSEEIIKVANSVCKFFSRNYNYTKNCILPSHAKSTSLQNVGVSCNKTIRDAWDGHFMRISHEYLSLFPFEALQAVYNFVGINYDLSVVEWLEKNTGIKTVHPRRRKRSVLSKDFYTTRRNSTAVLDAWRLKQDLSTVLRIQQTCQSGMHELGYIAVESKRDLKNISRQFFDLKRTLILN